jgi:hypothetical protein
MVTRLLLPLCVVVSARVSMAQGAIAGAVRDSAGVGLADAEVILDGRRGIRTASTGEFHVMDLRPGKVKLRVRRVGYEPRELEVAVRANEITRVTVVLDRRAILLDTIAVAASTKCAMRTFDGFYCRRKNGSGVFFDVEAIDSVNPRFPADMFRGVEGFRVDASPSGLRAVATTGWRCLRTLANGYPPSLQNPLPRWANEMIGLEIYADPNDVPGEYQRYIVPPRRCSLVNYWTQVRPRR